MARLITTTPTSIHPTLTIISCIKSDVPYPKTATDGELEAATTYTLFLPTVPC